MEEVKVKVEIIKKIALSYDDTIISKLRNVLVLFTCHLFTQIYKENEDYIERQIIAFTFKI